MQEIKMFNIRDAAGKLSAVIRVAEAEGGIVITNRGVPSVAMIPLNILGLKKFIGRIDELYKNISNDEINTMPPEFQTFIHATKQFIPFLSEHM